MHLIFNNNPKLPLNLVGIRPLYQHFKTNNAEARSKFTGDQTKPDLWQDCLVKTKFVTKLPHISKEPEWTPHTLALKHQPAAKSFRFLLTQEVSSFVQINSLTYT